MFFSSIGSAYVHVLQSCWASIPRGSSRDCLKEWQACVELTHSNCVFSKTHSKTGDIMMFLAVIGFCLIPYYFDITSQLWNVNIWLVLNILTGIIRLKLFLLNQPLQSGYCRKCVSYQTGCCDHPDHMHMFLWPWTTIKTNSNERNWIIFSFKYTYKIIVGRMELSAHNFELGKCYDFNIVK